MMKVWIFTEGHSEQEMLNQLGRRYCYSAKIEKDRLKFIESNDTHTPLLHITDCSSVDKIPHQINELNHRIVKSQCDTILVICDIEKEACPSKRKELIFAKIADEQIKNKAYLICACPMIEAIYCEELCTTVNVIKKQIKAIRNRDEKLNNIKKSCLEFTKYSKKSPQFIVKSIMKSYELTYKKREFSTSFFSQLDYKKSTNRTIQRLLSFFENKGIFEH